MVPVCCNGQVTVCVLSVCDFLTQVHRARQHTASSPDPPDQADAHLQLSAEARHHSCDRDAQYGGWLVSPKGSNLRILPGVHFKLSSLVLFLLFVCANSGGLQKGRRRDVDYFHRLNKPYRFTNPACARRFCGVAFTVSARRKIVDGPGRRRLSFCKALLWVLNS